MKENIIEIRNLNYNNIFIDFNIAFPNNKFISISGPNNCGKTTLIRILGRQLVTRNSVYLSSNRIENYKITDLSSIIQCVIPKEVDFVYQSLEDELKFNLNNTNLPTSSQDNLYKELIKIFKLGKYQKTDINNVEPSTLIKIQLVLALSKKPQILLIDNIGNYVSKKEMAEILQQLHAIQKKEEMTIIMATNDLNEVIESDYLYIIYQGNIILQGIPLEVLEKDNILNKIGLEVPFMIDLSVKLRDYDLIKDIELDMDRMVDKLWN